MANFLNRLLQLLWDGTKEPEPRATRQLPPPQPYAIGAPAAAPAPQPPAPSVQAAPQPAPAQPPQPAAPPPDPMLDALRELMRAAADERFALPPRTREALEQAERVERSDTW